MSTTATLDPRPVQVEAGAEASLPLHLRNDGEIIEEYRFRVVGRSRTWSEVVPNVVSLYPGQDTTASVIFRPPRSAAVVAGDFPYAVHVLPTEHPEDVVVPEGSVTLLPFHETTAELMPRASEGKAGARHRLAVDNWGNVPLTVTLTGADPGEMLDIVPSERSLTVQPGKVQFGSVRIRPVRKTWRGMPTTHTFAVTATPAAGPPVVLDGTYTQQPVLPSWLLKLTVALMLLALGLAVLAYLLFKPVDDASAGRVADHAAAHQAVAQIEALALPFPPVRQP